MPGVSAQKVEAKAGLSSSSWRRSVAQYWLTRSRCCQACVPGFGSPAGPRQSWSDTGAAFVSWRETRARACCSASVRPIAAAAEGAVSAAATAIASARVIVMVAPTRGRGRTCAGEALGQRPEVVEQLRRLADLEVHAEHGDAHGQPAE